MANLSVLVFVLYFFILREGTPPPSDAPEGGGDFFFVQEEGYGMTIHAKKIKPGCIS